MTRITDLETNVKNLFNYNKILNAEIQKLHDKISTLERQINSHGL